jgi:hypothetical protein
MHAVLSGLEAGRRRLPGVGDLAAKPLNMARSATILWCPLCKEEHPCESIPPGTFGEHRNVNRLVTESGINFFSRLRRCEGCGEDFLTAEIAHSTFHEMDRATSTLKAVKKVIRAG